MSIASVSERRLQAEHAEIVRRFREQTRRAWTLVFLHAVLSASAFVFGFVALFQSLSSEGVSGGLLRIVGELGLAFGLLLILPSIAAFGVARSAERLRSGDVMTVSAAVEVNARYWSSLGPLILISAGVEIVRAIGAAIAGVP